MAWEGSIERGVLDLNTNLGDQSVVIVGTRLPWLFTAFSAAGYPKLKYFSFVSSSSFSKFANWESFFTRAVAGKLETFSEEAALVEALLDEQHTPGLIVCFESKGLLSRGSMEVLIKSSIPQIIVPGRLGSEGNREVFSAVVSHAELGGVTSYQQPFSWYTLKKHDMRPPVPTAMRRDMRFSLKSGTPGVPAVAPPSDPRRIQQRVLWLADKVLSCHSLYPAGFKQRAEIVTPYHGGHLVRRLVQNSELLRFWDVSETFDPLLEPLLDHMDIETMCPVPVKVWSYIVDITQHSCSETSSRKRKASCPPVVGVTSPKRLRRTSCDVSPQAPGVQTSHEDLTKGALIQTLKEEGNNPEGNKKAVKSDDAAPPTFLWDCYTLAHVRVTDPVTGVLLRWERSFELLRDVMLRRWKRNRWRSALAYLREVTESGACVQATAREAIVDALTIRLPGCTFFEWRGGSIPFFWEWSPEYRDLLHKGVPVWLKASMNDSERWRKPQPRPAPEEKPKIEAKLSGFIEKDYLRLDPDVDALISFFIVPKGDSDIRVVFDATKSGLNSHLEAPWFPLPTGDSLLRSVQAGTWMADNDVGECFYNWRLDKQVIPFTGIDLSCYFRTSDSSESAGSARRGPRSWFSWQRPPMGCRPAPYISARCMALLKEETLGNRLDVANVFQWDELVLNCPGSPNYRPWMPPVFKQRKDGHIAADYVEFVDDRRPCGFSELVCWQVAQRAASVAALHGVQDASRKRRPPSQEPGSWAGYVVHTTDDKVRGLVDQVKWNKTRDRLKIIDENLRSSGTMNHKELERYRGFFIYVARVYPAMKPYLKGMHGTLDSWRPTVDADGWNVRWNKPSRKRKRTEDGFARGAEEVELDYDLPCGTFNEDGDFEAYSQLESAPKEVKFIPRMRSDLDALMELTQTETPPRRRLRPSQSAGVVYGFGDASGKGFGSALLLPDGTIPYCKGIWDYTVSAEHSSNYRELRNLVEAVEESAGRGELTDCEIWLFTDNFVSERAFYKGSSKNRELHHLVLRLRRLEMNAGMSLHIIHISGKRMILSGVDGLSRGDSTTGIMARENALSFVPLHLSALERSPALADWVRDWATNPIFLTNNQWPDKHRSGGIYVWTPPPGAARDMLDFATDSILKRPDSVHIFLIPRLMTAYWYKVLGKATDVLFTLSCGKPAWPADTLEPLIVAVSLPHSKKEPWIFKRSVESAFFLPKLCQVCKGSDTNEIPVLRQLLASAERFRVM